MNKARRGASIRWVGAPKHAWRTTEMIDSLPVSVGSFTGFAAESDDCPVCDERLVSDTRGELRPAEMIERKLVQLLRTAVMPVSHLSMAFRKR